MGRKKAVVETVDVPVAELIGTALNWAVAKVEEESEVCFEWHEESSAKRLVSHWNDYSRNGDFAQSEIYEPSVNWAQGGPLIEKYNVLLTPPTDMVHRNFGNFDKRNGWYEIGQWGSTIFGKECKHRRSAFHHPSSPLIVVCRAIVQFVLGDTVSVPKELLQ